MSILHQLQQRPRLTSIHSYGAGFDEQGGVELDGRWAGSR
jgi:hypothetical protein